MVALPIAKLASLGIKTLAKPMSKQVKHYFTKSPLSQQLLITIGQTTHNITTRMTILSAGYKVKHIPALETEKALVQGAEFIGEFFLFSVAGIIVVWEYDKSKMKEKKKDERLQEQIRTVGLDLKVELDCRLDELEVKLDKLEQIIASLNNNTNMDDSKGKGKGNSNSYSDRNNDRTENKKQRRGWLW